MHQLMYTFGVFIKRKRYMLDLPKKKAICSNSQL